MTDDPYRAEKHPDPEPKKSREQRFWDWCEREKEFTKACGVVFLIGAGIAVLILFMSECHDAWVKAEVQVAEEVRARKTKEAADLAAGKGERETRADVWMKRHNLEGIVTCFDDRTMCDVVPRDSRAPFRIECGKENCSVAR